MYASTADFGEDRLIRQLQPSILGLWLAVTQAGSPPARQADLASPHAQYSFVYLAKAKLFTRSLPFVITIFSVFAGIAVTATVISRRFVIACVLNVACLLWITGCALLLSVVIAAFSGDSNRHAQRAIRSAELVGTWEPTEQSLNLLFFSKGYHLTGEPHSISLGADGNLEFASVIHGYKTPTSRYDYLVTVGDRELTQLDPSKKFSPNHLKLRLDGPRFDLGQQFYIMEQDGELTLWHGIGDPFSGEYLEYKRTQNRG